MKKRTLEERFNELSQMIAKEKFLENKGLANEVGYYIFDYDPEDELEVREKIKGLQEISEEQDKYKLKVYDLYDILIEYLEEKGYLKMCYPMEENFGFQYLSNELNKLLKMSTDDNYFIEYVEKNTPTNGVVFLTGVGKLSPFITSASILNKMHQRFDRAPVVLFYPGSYDGLSLKLFNEIEDRNYYRAFPMVQ